MKNLLHWFFAKSALPLFGIVGVSLWAPRHVVNLVETVESYLQRWASNKRTVIAAIFVLAFLLQAAFSTLIYWPQPRVHDEFSYLLAADTFASGRLTNESHIFAEHFEAFHILQWPSYMSKYPPGQGMALGLGQWLTGKPLVGAWFSTALAIAACTWALFGWVASFWALLGGLLLVAHPVMFDWGQSYWGGAVAMLGGALLLGAVGRLRSQCSPLNLFWGSLGIAILANSRPFEGLVLTLFFFVFLFKIKIDFKRQLKKNAAVVLVVGLLTVMFMLYYNIRITKKTLRLPYQVHASQYNVAPVFLWQKPFEKPKYNHHQLDAFYAGFELWQYETQTKNINSFFFWVRNKLSNLFQEIFRLRYLLVGLLGVLWLMRKPDSSLKWLVGGGVFFLLMILQVTFFNLHYLSPAVGLLAVLLCLGLEKVHSFSWRGKPVGKTLVILGALWSLGPQLGIYTYKYWYKVVPFLIQETFDRRGLEQKVKAEGGKHLLMLPCAEPLSCAGISNPADVDNAAVVWAREMGAKADKKLINYFNDRKLWRLEKVNGRWDLVPHTL